MADGTLKVGTITTSSGSGTITLGQSGETITIPSGATVSGAIANTPAFSATASGSQTIASATNTILNFATENYDTDSDYDGTNKFTASVAGKYFFRANVRYDSMYDQDEIQLAFFKNGSQDSTTVTFLRVGKDNISVAFGITGVITLAVNDYVQVNTYHTRGSDRTTTAAATSFSGNRLIGV